MKELRKPSVEKIGSMECYYYYYENPLYYYKEAQDQADQDAAANRHRDNTVLSAVAGGYKK